MTRRKMLRLALAAPAVSLFPRFTALAQADRGKVKITAIHAMQPSQLAGNSLVRVDTDAGISGYGEAGSSGPMARARIETMKPFLIGKDPLAIELHFHEMTSTMHTYMAHIPTISGIDMALWDIAGKILKRPVFELLGGPFRDSIRMYSHGSGFDLLDPAACRAWAQHCKERPEGFTAYKVGISAILKIAMGRPAQTLDPSQVRAVAKAFHNVREAAGDALDIALHCHGEYDTTSAVALVKAIEPMTPLFVEDPLPFPFHEGWLALRRSTRTTLLAGEKLELVAGFKPFLDSQAVDIIHPDLAFAGGITGVRRIAHYAALTKNAVAFHNVGSIVLTYASAHLGVSIHNFYRSESQLGFPGNPVGELVAGPPPLVRNGALPVPRIPGLGVELNPDGLRKRLLPGEPWWG